MRREISNWAINALSQAACFRLLRTLPVLVLWCIRLMVIFRELSEIVTGMLLSDLGCIFPKRDTHYPMQTVFNAPVLAYCCYLLLIFRWQTGQEKPLFSRNNSTRFDHPNRLHHQNALYSRPFFEHVQLGWCEYTNTKAPGETTMTFVKGLLRKPGFHRL